MDFLDFLFPKKCIGCGAVGAYICSGCEVGLWEEDQICPGCGRNSRYGLTHVYCQKKTDLTGLICLWSYDSLAKELIKKAKFAGKFDLLNSLMPHQDKLVHRPEYQWFLDFLNQNPSLVPVPLHPNRLRERGFNQSELIAESLTDIWHLQLNDCLIRVIDTGHQTVRTRQERLIALKNVFQTSNFKFQIPQTVVLVDDVWTTGATLNECARTLKKSGIKNIWGFVLAR